MIELTVRKDLDDPYTYTFHNEKLKLFLFAQHDDALGDVFDDRTWKAIKRQIEAHQSARIVLHVHVEDT